MRITMTAAALVAALAISVIGAAGAQALPEYGRCLSAPGTGPYMDSACTLKASSEKLFAWSRTIEHPGFTLSGGETYMRTVSGTEIICSSLTGTGDYVTGGTAVNSVRNVRITFAGCSLPVGLGCRSAGQSYGTIVSEALGGKLLYTSKAKREVAQELHAMASTHGTLLAFECDAAVNIEAGGRNTAASCIFAAAAPLNAMTSTPTLVFAGAAGIQAPNALEGSSKRCNLETRANFGKWEKTDIAVIGPVRMADEEAIELRG